jgi:hypothetical protein
MRRLAVAKARFSIKSNEMTYGNWPHTRWWAPVHDFGSRDGRIPKRQFVSIQPEDATAIEELTMQWVEDAINRNVKRRYV